MKDTLVVNLFAGPGAGKSTFCAGIFARLKWLDVDCEMALEYAKDLVWEGSFKKMDNQLYIFGKQFHRIKRIMGKVNVIITDSPLMLSAVYDAENHETFKKLIVEEHNKMRTINYFIERQKNYNPNGRTQTLEQAKEIDSKILKVLTDNNVNVKMIYGDPKNIDVILADILAELKMNVAYEDIQGL